jgi:acylphosphatase
MAEVREKLIVSGRVQQVGYRAYVKQIARALKIKGYVKNLPDGDVEIVCQGEKEKVELFKKKIDRKGPEDEPLAINVTSITEEPAPEGVELGIFDIDYNMVLSPIEKEATERDELMILGAARLNSKIEFGFSDLGKKVETGCTDVGDKIESGFVRLEKKMDTGFTDLGNKIDSGFVRLEKKMDTGFTDLGNKIDSGFVRLEKKTDKGFSDLGKKIDDGFDRTHSDFNALDKKYHTVSESLKSIDNRLGALEEIFKKWLEIQIKKENNIKKRRKSK